MGGFHSAQGRQRTMVGNELLVPPPQDTSSSMFHWERVDSQGSNDSGYCDDMTKPAHVCVRSIPLQRRYYEQSFYEVPNGVSLDEEETHTSRSSSLKKFRSGPQTDADLSYMGTEHDQSVAKSRGVFISSASRRTVSPPTNETSNDGLSSRPAETSTPESDCSWLAEYSEDEDMVLEESHPFTHFKRTAVATVFDAFLRWREFPLERDSPCDGASKANGEPSKEKGKATGSATGKRKLADRLEHNKGVNDHSERSSTQTTETSSKRRRTHDRHLTFACPYTKKDPMSYRDCYRYKLSRIRDVKQHLDRCHRNPPYCPRCRSIFGTEEERDGHIREISCPVRPSTAFEGITEAQKEQLRRKSASNTSVEAQWFVVFEILFPGHDPRPQSPYIDTELLQDITLYQDYLMSNGPRILSEVLTHRGAITWNLPNEERDLAAFQQTVFGEGLRGIFDQWVARRGPSREDSNISSISGTASELTPPSSSNWGEGTGPTSNQAPRIPPAGIISTLPSQDVTNALAGIACFQEASTGRDTADDGEIGILNIGQGGHDFHQGLTYDGPDEELMRLMFEIDDGSSFQPALG